MELATVPAVHPHMCGDSVKASMSDCWCWATEMTVGGLLDSHHYLSLVTAWKAELPLFFLSPFSLCGHPPPHPHRIFWNAIMDQWAPPSVVLLVNIYWVEQQPLPSLERGALQSLGAILCVCVCVYIFVCVLLSSSFHSTVHSAAVSELLHFSGMNMWRCTLSQLHGAVLSVCLSLCSLWGSSFDKGI